MQPAGVTRLAYRPAALADLDAIEDYIAAYDHDRAVNFVRDVRVQCLVLCGSRSLVPPVPT